MAQIINPEIMDELRALGAPLYAAAMRHAPEMTSADPTAPSSETAIAEAEHVTAFIAASSALLQSFPLTQRGVIVAVASIAGVVLGQCDGDRSELYAIFKHQMALTLAEINAARMPHVGTA